MNPDVLYELESRTNDLGRSSSGPVVDSFRSGLGEKGRSGGLGAAGTIHVFRISKPLVALALVQIGENATSVSTKSMSISP